MIGRGCGAQLGWGCATKRRVCWGMLVVRLLGGGIFAAALISLILDVRQGLRTGSGLGLTSLENLWLAVHPDSLQTVQALLLQHTPPWVSAYLVQPLLLIPIALMFVLGLWPRLFTDVLNATAIHMVDQLKP